MYSLPVQTPLGLLILQGSDQGLVSAHFDRSGQEFSSPLLEEAARQIQQWFARERTSFALPLDMRGTKFQQAVWRQLQAIPWGQTRSYGEIAAFLGKPGAARAVGGACGANPLVLIIPCHRVLAGDGRLGGFSSGLERKQQLLSFEGIKWK